MERGQRQRMFREEWRKSGWPHGTRAVGRQKRRGPGMGCPLQSKMNGMQIAPLGGVLFLLKVLSSGTDVGEVRCSGECT